MKFRRPRSGEQPSVESSIPPESWSRSHDTYDFETNGNSYTVPSSDSAYELQRQRSLNKEQADALQQHVTPLLIHDDGHIPSRRDRTHRSSRRAASVGRFFTRTTKTRKRRSQSVDKRKSSEQLLRLQHEHLQQHQHEQLQKHQHHQQHDYHEHHREQQQQEHSNVDEFFVRSRPLISHRKEQHPENDITSVSYDNSDASDREENYRVQEIPGVENKEPKKKKSKMEKIRQLQAKNELYKEEFKRVQKDRKQLKKEMETKKLQIAALTKEMDEHISETAILKSKLSQALQESDHLDSSSRQDKQLILQLSKELTDSQVELDRAQERIDELTDKLHSLRDTNRRQDDEMETLTAGLTQQAEEIEKLREENAALMENASASETGEHQVEKLRKENEKLHKELGSTLERAANMVKEREDAIADLLKENDEMKARQQAPVENKESEEELLTLREEMSETTAALEECQDRNAMLEEEVEAWIRRGRDMEADINRLLVDVASWKQKAVEAEQERDSLKETAEKAEGEVSSTRQSLEAAESKYQSQLAEMEEKLREMKRASQEEKHAAKLKAQEDKEAAVEAVRKQLRAAQEKVASNDDGDASVASSQAPGSASSSLGSTSEGMDAQAQQAMLLEKALASRQKKADSKKSAWFFGKSAEAEELTEEQKKIKDLEATNADQAEEILKLKSELVRLRSTYNETLYVNKKKLEQLETDNETLKEKNTELELKLEAARCV